MITDLGTKLHIFFCCKLVGKDIFGNCYYQSRREKNENNLYKRFVIYKGKKEASKVPPLYNAWLRSVISEFPKKIKNFPWQKEYESNLTGTKLAYHPALNEDHKKSHEKSYEAWQPDTKHDIA